MRHHFLWWLNFSFLALTLALLLGAIWIQASRSPIVEPPLIPKVQTLPPSPFKPKNMDYSPLGKPALQLGFQSPKMRVPDLKPLIHYQGHNLRPDAKEADSLFLTLGPLSETNPPFLVKERERIYLISQDDPKKPYALSPANRPTSLWFEAERKGNTASIQVKMQDEKGEIQEEPLERTQFVIPEKPLSPLGQNKNFMIGTSRADAALLSRQKARWQGKDQFLEDHGGPEFENVVGKQRVQFGEGEEAYSVYLGKDDVMIWKDDHWVVPEKDQPTQSYPLARVNKVEERIMNFDLFDPSGKNKVVLNLLKLQEAPLSALIPQDFQFIGARTKVHSTFKVSGKRMMIGPGDWFLHTPEGWIKLRSAKEIDAFVKGITPGALLVIDRIEDINEERYFAATLYSRSRATAESILLPLKAQGSEPMAIPEKEKILDE